jgi:hypothetical protein
MAEPGDQICAACGQAFPDEASLEAHVRTIGLVD